MRAVVSFLASLLRRQFLDRKGLGFRGSERKIALVDQMTPPTDMNFVGAGDFKEIGENFLQYFINPGGLKRTDSVLDVGCGIGRMAIPLTQYLDRTASYEGFDVVADGIKWCQKHITSRYPNFRFKLANVKNNMYRRNGKVDAFNYEFPYEDGSFDFVFLTSVFTHLRPREMEHYLGEIFRVLKTGKRSFITYFLINGESFELMDNGRSAHQFTYVAESGEHQYYTINKGTPESAIAYDEDYVRACYKENRLRIIEPIQYGYWCGRSKNNCVDFQDIIVATKVDSSG